MEGQVPQAQTPQAPAGQAPVITLGEWMIMMLITAIPVVGLIMLLVWAFSSEENPTKANFAKAALIWMAIGIVFSILFFGAIMGTVMSQY